MDERDEQSTDVADHQQPAQERSSWGPNLFMVTLGGLLIFFWWLLIYSGGVVLHH